MARSDQVGALVRSHNNGDDSEFRRTTEEIIADERRKRHDVVADQLEATLTEGATGRRPPQVTSLRSLPKSRDELPLLSIAQPRRSVHDLVLPSSTRTLFDSLIAEFRMMSSLRAHGVEPRSSILLVGPPGCGKSASAEALAGELGLPLAKVELSAIVSSFLGETARNLEQIFNFVATGSWVLTFDEFDMLGRERGDRADHGELKRVVAALLQTIEGHNPDTLFVATSNHPTLLDSAVWRRFGEVIELKEPDETGRQQILELKLQSVRHRADLRRAAKETAGFSGAEVESVALDAIRSMVLRIDKAVNDEHVAYGIERGAARRRIIHTSQD